MTIATNPEQLGELKKDPQRWAPAFVEELCRYHTASAMAMKRVAKEDVEIGGKVRRPSIPASGQGGLPRAGLNCP